MYLPVIVKALAVTGLQSFDPGATLFICSAVALLGHDQCDLLEYRFAFDAAFQPLLDGIAPPDGYKSVRLTVAPCQLRSVRSERFGESKGVCACEYKYKCIHCKTLQIIFKHFHITKN